MTTAPFYDPRRFAAKLDTGLALAFANSSDARSPPASSSSTTPATASKTCVEKKKNATSSTKPTRPSVAGSDPARKRKRLQPVATTSAASAHPCPAEPELVAPLSEACSVQSSDTLQDFPAGVSEKAWSTVTSREEDSCQSRWLWLLTEERLNRLKGCNTCSAPCRSGVFRGAGYGWTDIITDRNINQHAGTKKTCTNDQKTSRCHQGLQKTQNKHKSVDSWGVGAAIIYTYTCICTYIHTYIHTYRHTYICIYVYIHIHKQANVVKFIAINTNINVQTLNPKP